IVVVALFGARPDFAASGIAIALKSGFGLAAGLVTAPALYSLARPNVQAGPAALVALGFIAWSFLAAAIALGTSGSFEGLGLAMGIPECIKRVPILAAPIAALSFAIVRSFAPTRLTLAGAAIGAFSGALAIIPYAWFCRFDSAAYVFTWYPVSIVICA